MLLDMLLLSDVTQVLDTEEVVVVIDAVAVVDAATEDALTTPRTSLGVVSTFLHGVKTPILGPKEEDWLEIDQNLTPLL